MTLFVYASPIAAQEWDSQRIKHVWLYRILGPISCPWLGIIYHGHDKKETWFLISGRFDMDTGIGGLILIFQEIRTRCKVRW